MSTSIRGEYWIVDGEPHYVNGDVGDTNHSGFALDFLRREIFDALGMDVDEYYDWDEEVKILQATVAFEFNRVFELEDPVRPLLESVATELELDLDLIAHVFDWPDNPEDLRGYVARKFGWIICHGNTLGVHFLDRGTIDTLCIGVGEIIDGEGIEDEEALVLTIFVASTGNTYSVNWMDLQSGDYATLGLRRIDLPVGPSAAVAKLDRDLEPEFYKRK
jgi:hypothetical protein